MGTGAFHHVAVVVHLANSYSSKVELFIDGVSQGYFTRVDGSDATTIQDSTSDIRLGYIDFVGGYDGVMDEIGLWNRALTSSEISQLYNSGSGLPYSSF